MSANSGAMVPVGFSLCRAGSILLILLSSFAPLGRAADWTLEDGNQIVVQVDRGVRRVRLEILNVESEEWSLISMAHVSGRAGSVRFLLPDDVALDHIRVRTSSEDGFTHRVFAEKRDTRVRPLRSAVAVDAYRSAPSIELVDAGTAGDDASAVVESDIWRVNESTVYFFNQLRGLQIFDLSNSDEPELSAHLRLPAVGDQMYVLQDRYVLLLVRQGRADSFNSEIAVVDRSEEPLGVVQRIALPGSIIESRMVGDVLYIVSRSFARIAGSIVVTSIDFSIPEEPEVVADLSIRGFQAVVTATDAFLLVATETPGVSNRSTVHIFDISSGNGDVRLVGAPLHLGGTIADKFKMQINDGILTTISFVWLREFSRWSRLTQLETFALAEAEGEHQALGSLTLGDGETLHATRFDGDRVYIVTFFQIDPLWAIDLSDPAEPEITAELEIPGWSTFLQAIGDKLLAVGVEDRQVTVSLFDVADPTAPSMLERVRLGEDFSWSEANYDEKAVSVLLEEGLVLVPFQSYSDGVPIFAMQLVDLVDDTVVLRGIIEHDFEARRATAVAENLVSLSGRELLIVDAGDRDSPEVRAALEIAWPVDRLLVVGDTLIEIENGNLYQGDGAVLRVAAKDSPDRVVTTVEFPERLIIGAALSDALLAIAHVASSADYPFIGIPEIDVGAGAPESEIEIVTALFDLSAIPELPLFGEAAQVVELPSWGLTTEAAIFSGELLVWFARNNDFGVYPYDYRLPHIGIEPFIDIDIGIIGYPYYRFEGVILIAIDLHDAGDPEVLATVSPLDSVAPFEVSDSFTAGDLVAFSYDSLIEDVDLRGVASTFQVVDFSDASHPIVRDPLPIPGRLVGFLPVDQDEYILQTVTDQASTDPFQGFPLATEIHASVYDGLSVFLLDELSLEGVNRFSAVTFRKSLFLIDNDFRFKEVPSVLHFELDAEGIWQERDPWTPALPAHSIRVVDGVLAGLTQSSLELAEITEDDGIIPLGGFSLPPIWQFDLGNMTLDGERGIWFSVGEFGVEFFDFSDISITVRPQREPVIPILEVDWRILPDADISATAPTDPEEAPLAELTDWVFVSDSADFEAGSMPIGDGWHGSEWLGRWYDTEFPWIFHEAHGWWHVAGLRSVGEGFWAYDPELGHLWTDSEVYPHLWSADLNSWVYYLPESHAPRWFYNHAVEEWVEIRI